MKSILPTQTDKVRVKKYLLKLCYNSFSKKIQRIKMTINLNDPQIEAIFINEFKSDINAFTKFIKESIKTRKNQSEQLDSLKKDNHNSGISFSKYKIDAFKNIQDPVEWQRKLRSEWDR